MHSMEHAGFFQKHQEPKFGHETREESRPCNTELSEGDETHDSNNNGHCRATDAS
jgi:hypothetical protein